MKPRYSRKSGQPLSTGDIPIARRTGAPSAKSNSWLMGVAVGTGSLLLSVALAAVWRPGPLKRLFAPPPVDGLNARAGLDGRLLGHFPYGELPASKRVAIAAGFSLHRDAAEAFLELQRDAATSGHELIVLSAYRSHKLQNELFFDVKSDRNQSARERAMVSAPPGFSEHSTGFAIDLGDGLAPATNLSPEFEQTPAFAWLKANAARYHFTLSFPRGNSQGVSYEPWHWRFEGSAEALQIFEPAQRLAR